MKSNKQKRAEIKRKRQARVLATADLWAWALHHATDKPPRYADQPFVCVDCGAHEVWTAKQQKWWHEVAHGSVYSVARRCAACRRTRRRQRAHSQATSALDQQIARLRVLAPAPPDAAARAEMQAALTSKWEGVRVVAIGVLGAWWHRHGHPADLARLRAFAAHGQPGQARWSDPTVQAAQKALAEHLGGT
ncbi:MAG: zinc-ribbon domain containing protein [Pseudomonadota bacterium]|nr:zinc-ribbon domain containing protein [Pseudomonadota bacterium]